MDATLNVELDAGTRRMKQNAEVQFLLFLQGFIVIGLIVAYFGIPILREYVKDHQIKNTTPVGIVQSQGGF